MCPLFASKAVFRPAWMTANPSTGSFQKTFPKRLGGVVSDILPDALSG